MIGKIYKNSPLPFQGQKSGWFKEFQTMLENFKDCTTIWESEIIAILPIATVRLSCILKNLRERPGSRKRGVRLIMRNPEWSNLWFIDIRK